MPSRAIGLTGVEDVRVAVDHVFRGSVTETASPQIHDAVGHAKQEGITIPVITDGCDRQLRPRQGERRFDPLTVLAAKSELGFFLTLRLIRDIVNMVITVSGGFDRESIDRPVVIPDPVVPPSPVPDTAQVIEAEPIAIEIREQLGVAGISSVEDLRGVGARSRLRGRRHEVVKPMTAVKCSWASLPTFASTIRTSLAMPTSAVATWSACALPGASLSVTMTTSAPRRHSLYSSRHLPAPPGLQVATAPTPSRASTSFSPSAM